MGGGSVGLFSGLWLSEVVGDMVVYEPVPTRTIMWLCISKCNAAEVL